MSATTAIHDEHRDDFGAKMGMWLFLFTELLLFGGLFLVYTIYRYLNPTEFAHGGHELDLFIGTVNTVVLLTSSLTVAISISAIQKGNKKLATIMLWLTIAAALAFMVNKYFEWGHKFHIGLIPGADLFNSLPPAERLFFLLYYFMTGLHGLHVVIGAILLLFVIRGINNGSIQHDNFAFHENAGLYWHLVDLIWIYLFPLMYLIH